VSADATSGPAAVPRPGLGLVRPRLGLVTASGWAALLTGACAIWLAIELRVSGPVQLPWLGFALPPVLAGAICLARRRDTSLAPAAVFASCAGAAAFAVEVPDGVPGLTLAAWVSLLLCAGVAVVVSGIVTAVMISVSGKVSRRRGAVWIGAGFVFAALSIPSPIFFPGGPILTIFAGNSGGENAAAVCSLVLLALPLVVAGLASAGTATVIAVAWLPEAGGQLLWRYYDRLTVLHLDAWYFVTWFAWLAIAALTAAEALRVRAGH
jgi:hypothetical protein